MATHVPVWEVTLMDATTVTSANHPLLRVPDAARALAVSESTLRRMIAAGRLRAVTVSPRCVRILRADVDALLTPTAAQK